MIIPFVSGILSFRFAPATWTLFILNLLVYVISSFPAQNSQTEMHQFLKNIHFTEAQGRHFADYIVNSNIAYPENLQRVALKVLEKGDYEAMYTLSSLSISDPYFSKAYKKFSFSVDPVLTKWWKRKFTELNSMRKAHPSSVFGLTGTNHNVGQVISYLFYHSGAMHLIGNMLFLMIFGCALESLLGSLTLLLVYLFSGITAATVFYLLEPASSVPLIGASGAVSGLMAMFCFLFWNRSVRFFYLLFLIPIRGYFGIIYLPAWVAMAMWLCTDLAGYISSPSVMGGGVAHSAHLGGELAGLFAGFLLYAMRKWVVGNSDPITGGLVDTKPALTKLHF